MPVMIKSQTRFVVALLVEDNPTDVLLIQEALKRSKYPIYLGVTHNGEEALEYLRREGLYADAVPPDIILLDLSLPKVNGWKVLETVKRDSGLSRIPILVVTGAQNGADEIRARQLKADDYLVKPPDMSYFPRLIQSVERAVEA